MEKYPVFHRCRCCMIVVDEAGRLCSASVNAEQVLSAPGALRVQDGRLTADTPQAAERLRAAIAAACRRRGAQPGVLRLRQEVGALSVLVAPAGGGRAEVIATQPDRPWPVNAAMLAQEFGLSPAEADVAVRLSQGQDVATVARGRRVSAETVRTQLKNVLAKTGGGNQAALVGIVCRSLAALRHGGA